MGKPVRAVLTGWITQPMKLLSAGIVLMALAACGTSGPPSAKVQAEVLEVAPTHLSGNTSREIKVRLRIRNTTGYPMWLLSRDFWYHPQGGGVTISQASAYTKLGNTSSCTPGPVSASSGVTCTLYFEWATSMQHDVLVPGIIRWSDPSGYSHANANGNVWVNEWLGFTPP